MLSEEKFNIDKAIESIDFLKKEIDSVSDRACAIVCSSFLEELLERIILSFLTDATVNQDKQLTNQNGPLSTFSSKIIMSFRLGLISKKEYDNLNLVRKIRNHFAHDLGINSFNCGTIRSLLCENVPNEKLLPPIEIPISYMEHEHIIFPTPDEFIKIVSDENLYNTILPQFPRINFVEIDHNDMRSIFTGIVYVLQTCLTSRLYTCLINQRQTASEYNDIVEIEHKKIIQTQTKEEEQLDSLKNLKDTTLQDISKIDSLICKNQNQEELSKIKLELIDHLKRIEQLIQEKDTSMSIMQALQIHTYRILNYQINRKQME